MGCEFDSFIFKGSMQDLENEFKTYCKDVAYCDGNVYSGRLNMCPGLEIKPNLFKTIVGAEDFVMQAAQKWERAIAVEFGPPDDRQWFVGGWCSS